MRIEISVLGLHDMVVRKPFDRGVGTLVDGGRMQRDSLVVCNIAPSLPFTGEEFRVETPCYDRIDDDIITAVQVMLLGNREELPVAIGGTCSVENNSER